MSSKHRSSGLSTAEKARSALRQAYQDSSTRTDSSSSERFRFQLYENDREERINQIADDEDGDLIVQRQPAYPAPTGNERNARTIEANDRRHDAVIFGDKTVEVQHANQSYNSYKQSSKYTGHSLAGPLLLEDRTAKRLRWQNQMRELWLKRFNGETK